jgi:hypothetical protein
VKVSRTQETVASVTELFPTVCGTSSPPEFGGIFVIILSVWEGAQLAPEHCTYEYSVHCRRYVRVHPP